MSTDAAPIAFGFLVLGVILFLWWEKTKTATLLATSAVAIPPVDQTAAGIGTVTGVACALVGAGQIAQSCANLGTEIAGNKYVKDVASLDKKVLATGANVTAKMLNFDKNLVVGTYNVDKYIVTAPIKGAEAAGQYLSANATTGGINTSAITSGIETGAKDVGSAVKTVFEPWTW